jgi:hypothetical protein
VLKVINYYSVRDKLVLERASNKKHRLLVCLLEKAALNF